jgi:hypothetical protein
VPWQRWTSNSLSLDPAPLLPAVWPNYYAGQLAAGQYGTIALFYSAGSDANAVRGEASLRAGNVGGAYAQLHNLPNLVSGMPGTGALTAALATDPAYRLVAIGPYDTSTLAGNHIYAVYAIWVKKGRS